MSDERLDERVEASSGWGVLHLFYRVNAHRGAEDPGSAQRVLDAIEAFEGDEIHQALTFTVLGHKADVGIMAVGPDLARLQAFQQALGRGPWELAWSYVSLTEASEYSVTEDDERAR